MYSRCKLFCVESLRFITSRRFDLRALRLSKPFSRFLMDVFITSGADSDAFSSGLAMLAVIRRVSCDVAAASSSVSNYLTGGEAGEWKNERRGRCGTQDQFNQGHRSISLYKVEHGGFNRWVTVSGALSVNCLKLSPSQ